MEDANRHETAQQADAEWITFPGGELEGIRPKVLCPGCRERLKRAEGARGRERNRPLCFQCYRAGLDRQRALKAAGQLDTASEPRFQAQLPFEPVNRARLAMLKADRASARAESQPGVARFGDARRRAQIAARHALQGIAAGVAARQLAPADRERLLAVAVHAAELQLPDSWLPFVVAR